MIYPKDVVDFVRKNQTLSERFPEVASIDSVTVSSVPVKHNDFSFEEYMLTEGFTESRAIRKYLLFLTSSYDIFNDIFQFFPKTNPNSTHKDDVSAIGTAPFELFYHALYLYCLDSWGVEGDVIECGTYKGFSACCLSWVCSYLGRKLIVADSFEGLPENDTDPYYKKGDFCGQLDEVKANIEDFGRIDQVEFLKGFYETSLKGFNRPLCMLWMDVDLFESATDILTHAFASLSERGVLISHELFADRDFAGNQLKDTIGPSKAFVSYFTDHNISYRATPLENGSGLVVPGKDGVSLLISSEHVQYLRDRCRPSDQLLMEQRNTLQHDIAHWRNEVDKLMDVYRSTFDYRIKESLKGMLGKVGLYRK